MVSERFSRSDFNCSALAWTASRIIHSSAQAAAISNSLHRAGTHIGNLFGKETGRFVTPEKGVRAAQSNGPPGDIGG